MNRRAVIQVLIILLLVLLLVFWALGAPGSRKRIVRRGVPNAGKVETDNARMPLDETVLEKDEEMSQAPPEEKKPVTEAVSHSGWVNNGAYEVFGEVKNVGNNTARQVKARVIFKNGKWERLGEVENLVDNPTLAPGQKSGFKVVFKTGDPKTVGSYVLLFTVAR